MGFAMTTLEGMLLFLVMWVIVSRLMRVDNILLNMTSNCQFFALGSGLDQTKRKGGDNWSG